MGRLIPYKYIYSMDQYLLIPFLVGWTSINPSYFDVNYRGTIGFDTLPYIFNCFNHLQKYECQWEGLFHIYICIYNIYIYDMENKNMFETTKQIYSASHPTDPTTSEVLSAAARAELPVHFLQRATFPSPKKTTWRSGKYIDFMVNVW